MGFHRHVNEQYENHKILHEEIRSEIHKNKKKCVKFSRKIFLSLGISIMSILLVTNFIIGGIFTSYRYYHQKKEVKQISENIKKIADNNELEKNTEFLKNLIYENVYVQIIDKKSGKIYFDTYSSYLASHNEKTNFLSYIDMKFETNLNPKYEVIILKNIQNEKGFILQFVMIMMLVNVLSIFIILITSKILTFRILLPINQIIDTTEKISSENLSQRIKVFPANDELTRLSTVINNMINRLEKSFVLQKKFVSDVSHELRTPLQIIKGYTDFILDKGIKDEALMKESLTFIKEEVDNMIKLTENLLFMAKSEKNIRKLELAALSIHNLCEKIKNDITLTNPEVNLIVTGDEEIVGKIDKKLILQAMRAVVDNAIKYSQGKNSIDLRYLIQENKLIIEIEDYGIGIEQNELGNIFERFYRVDESRSKEIKGTGLGLSIAKNIMELHEGAINIESEVGKGTKVKLIIPLKI